MIDIQILNLIKNKMITERDSKGRIVKNWNNSDKKWSTKIKEDQEHQRLFEEFIKHVKAWYSKTSFWPLDRTTIKRYTMLFPDIWINKKIEEAEREAKKFYEQLAVWTAAGKVKSSWIMTIFLLKNKYPDEFRDRQEIEHNGAIGTQVVFWIPKSQFIKGSKANHIKEKKRKSKDEIKE